MWAQTSLRTRLLLLVALPALPALVVVILSWRNERSHALDMANEAALSHARHLIAMQHEARSAAQQLLGSIANLPAIKSGSVSACSETLGTLLHRKGMFINLGMTDPNGRAVCSAIPSNPVVDISDRRYFRSAIATREFVTGDYQLGRVTGHGSISYALPVYEGATLRGVLFAVLPLASMGLEGMHSVLPGGSFITLIDPDFTVVARFPADDQFGKSIVGSDIQRFLAEAGEQGTRSLPGLVAGQHLQAFTKVRGGAGELQGYVLISIPDDAILSPVNEELARDLALFALLVIAIGITAAIGSKVLVLDRIKSLLDATRKLAAGDLGARVAHSAKQYELDVLGAAFNTMAEKIEAQIDELGSLTRTRAMLTEITGAILRIRDVDALAQEACRIAVQTGNYLSATVLIQDVGAKVNIAGHAGVGREYFDELGGDIVAILARYDTPLARLFRSGNQELEQDFERAPDFPWKQRILASGARAVSALPLKTEGQLVGALVLWASEPAAFNEDELKLLLQIAADTGLGLEHIGQQARLAEQIEELRRWQDVMLDTGDRIQELKSEVNGLCRSRGEPVRYLSQEGDSDEPHELASA